MAHEGHAGGGWSDLLDPQLAQFDRIGNANWRVEGGTVVSDKGIGYLVTKKRYANFEIRAEFYAETDTNSGIFIRCQNPKEITAASCYEVNIWDTRPKPEYGTGAIVDVSQVNPMPKAGGKWNHYEVTARGDHLVVVLNGQKTVDVRHAKLADGVIGLQHAAGVKDDTSPIKFRKVQIRPL
jgi:hypothetical protein